MPSERRKVKFSHLYTKMICDNCRRYAKLIQVIKVNYNDLSKFFIEYDTRFYVGNHYELPKEDLIILFLLTDDRLWTTIRRYTSQKFEYYQSLVGQDVDIEVTEK
jgi:hypothetical protein